jgi:aryl-alcohol dehydrogenase-like predicted oxidoreductase
VLEKKKSGVPLVTMALQWCLSRWYVTSTIIGATTIEQLQVARFPAKVCVLLNALDSMTIWGGYS